MNQAVRPVTQVLCALALSALLGACTTTTIDEERQRSAPIAEGDALVVLGRRHNSDYETEPGFISCIGDRIDRETPIHVYGELDFMNQLYPWFEPRTAPMALKRLEGLMEIPEFADRMQDMGMRYIIWIDGSTETIDSMGSISCAIGPGGAGCIGFGAWEDDSTYEAAVWDVRQLQSVARFSAEANGTSYMPAIVIPIPLIARVKASACDGLASQLQTLFITPEGDMQQ